VVRGVLLAVEAHVMLPVMAAAQPSDFKRAGIIVVMSIGL
jgi:hypothetical protein